MHKLIFSALFLLALGACGPATQDADDNDRDYMMDDDMMEDEEHMMDEEEMEEDSLRNRDMMSLRLIF
jgi:hypothetical protein